MAYVQRDNNGAIVTVFACRQPGYAEEAVADDNPEVAALLNLLPPEPEPAVEERIAALEEKASRASKLEAALVQKGTITTDAIDVAVAVEADLKAEAVKG